MAEIAETSSGEGSGKTSSRRNRSPRIDMTPMVDLGFLLLTFFILTTTFHKKHIMELTMPDPSGTPSPVNEDNVLNLVLAENDRVFWWTGSAETIHSTNYSKEGLRRVILQSSKENGRRIILIKPASGSTYGNLVDVLDEMEITGAKRFAIVPFTRDDEEWIQRRQ